MMLYLGIPGYGQSKAASLVEEQWSEPGGAFCRVPSLPLTASTAESGQGFSEAFVGVLLFVYCAGILKREVAPFKRKWALVEKTYLIKAAILRFSLNTHLCLPFLEFRQFWEMCAALSGWEVSVEGTHLRKLQDTLGWKRSCVCNAKASHLVLSPVLSCFYFSHQETWSWSYLLVQWCVIDFGNSELLGLKDASLNPATWSV